MNAHLKAVYLLLAICLLPGIAAGCKSKEKRREARPSAPILSPEAIDRVVDQAAQSLARKLPAVPAVASAQRKQVLAIGPIRNETGTASVAFDAAIRRLQGLLGEAKPVTDSFILTTTSDADARDILNAIQPTGAGEFGDPLSGKDNNGRPVKYNLDSIYVLSGRFFEQRGVSGETGFTLMIQAEHPRTRTVVVSESFRINLVWNKDNERWEEVNQ